MNLLPVPWLGRRIFICRSQSKGYGPHFVDAPTRGAVALHQRGDWPSERARARFTAAVVPLGVAGGEEVEQGPAQDGQRERTSLGSIWSVAFVRGWARARTSSQSRTVARAKSVQAPSGSTRERA